MNEISHYLTTEHKHCDDLFADAENAVLKGDWKNAQTHFQGFLAATQLHFTREETVLFPAFEATTGMRLGPTEVMRNEHLQIRELMEDMEQVLAEKDSGSYLGLAETLLMLISQHNMKEEQMLYPMTDKTLNDTAGEMVSQMERLSL